MYMTGSKKGLVVHIYRGWTSITGMLVLMRLLKTFLSPIATSAGRSLLFLIRFLARKKDLMSATISNPISRHTANGRNGPNDPPRHSDYASFHPHTKPPACQNRSKSAERSRASLAKTMYGSQN